MITKHIQQLAEQVNKARTKDFKKQGIYSDTDEQYKEDNINYYANELTRIKNALIKGNYYTGVSSVSRSGMSRKIKLAYTYKNKLRVIRDKYILSLAGVSENGNISGCGMDMLFHAQYLLFNRLHKTYKQANYSKRMARYNSL